MRKKVLYIITKSDVGGAQKYVADLVSNLDRNKFEAKILYGSRDVHWLIRDTKPWFLFLPDWLAILELVKIYKYERPDIIHLNSSKTGVLGAIAAKIYNGVQRIAFSVRGKLKKSNTLNANRSPLTAKVIFTAHGWVFNPTNALSFPTRWFYIAVHKIAAYFQDKIICVSEYDYNLALNYKIASPTKLITVHNGIDPNMKFLDKVEAKKELIKKLNPNPLTLNPQYPWIGSIGRLTKEKNYATLIEASSLTPDAYFFIIGAGAELNNLRQTTYDKQLQNRFFIIEPTGNDSQYLTAFDIFVMSSIKEGLPYILLEAMAARIPPREKEGGGGRGKN